MAGVWLKLGVRIGLGSWKGVPWMDIWSAGSNGRTIKLFSDLWLFLLTASSLIRIYDDQEDHADYATPALALGVSSEPVPSTSRAASTSRSDTSSSASTSARSVSAAFVQNPSNAALMARCREFLDQLELGTAPWIVQRLSSTYGRIPTDVSSFSFWVASVLPIDEHEKAKLLPIRSPRLRLLLVVHWIEQLNNNWYKAFSLLRLAKTVLLLIGLFVFFSRGLIFRG